MGLKELDANKLNELKHFLELFEFFGITEDDLKYLPEALKKVKEMENPSKRELTEEQKKKIEEKNKNSMTMEDFYNKFNTDIEEFNPNPYLKESKDARTS